MASRIPVRFAIMDKTKKARREMMANLYRSEKLIPMGNDNRWTCPFEGGRLKLYIGEMPTYTMVGVCDADDGYIRAEFDSLEPALVLYERISAMPIILIADLLALGMNYD